MTDSYTYNSDTGNEDPYTYNSNNEDNSPYTYHSGSKKDNYSYTYNSDAKSDESVPNSETEKPFLTRTGNILSTLFN